MRYYHIWFRTKFKKNLLVDVLDKTIQELFERISTEKKIELLAQGTLLDHAHLLIGLRYDQGLPWAVKMFKGISARRLFQENPLLKQNLKVNNLWARKYDAREVSVDQLYVVTRYVLNQKKDLFVL
jgi:putative transposase